MNKSQNNDKKKLYLDALMKPERRKIFLEPIQKKSGKKSVPLTDR